MAQYVCKVADNDGRVFQQVEAAQTEVEARQKLADRGLYVYWVRPRLAFIPRGIGRRKEGAVGSTDFLIFNQQFNTLIKAGLPILKALDLLTESAAAPRLRPILENVRRRVREGALLSEALDAEGIFPKVYTTSVLAGEKSGSLSSVLEQYVAYQRVTTGVRKRLLAALVYPTILVTVATLVIAYVTTVVIPQFARLYRELNVDLPPLTQFLMTLTVGLRIPILVGVILLVAVAFGAYLWSFTPRGAMILDRIKLRIPVFGNIWIKFQVARFSRTLATLLAGGTPLVTALETASDATSSRWVSQAIYEAGQRVREGKSLHNSLAETGLMPDLALEMIEVGEASGALTPMLVSIAEFYEEDVNLRLSALLSLIEPLILVMMAIVVAFILIALYLPVFSLSVGSVGN
jgi:type IV pilus assembly protein PilC